MRVATLIILGEQVMMSNEKMLLELHIMYWALSEENKIDFPVRTYSEFIAFLEILDNQNKSLYVANLQKLYEELVEKSVSEGMKVIEEYLQPE